MAPLCVNLDFETYSEADIFSVGGYCYAQHPSTEALLLAWKTPGTETSLIDFTRGEVIPPELLRLLDNPDVIIRAYNAEFEWLIFNFVLDIRIPYSRFSCTMANAWRLGFSGSMAEVQNQLNIARDKVKDAGGKRLILKFSKPAPKNRKTTRYDESSDPDDWELFREYCIQDVVAEESIQDAIAKYQNLTHEERALEALSHKINAKGVPIDLSLVSQMVDLDSGIRQLLKLELHESTSLDNPNSVQQLVQWFHERDVPVKNLRAETVSEWVDKLPEGSQERQVMHLRQSLGSTASKKWAAFQKAVNPTTGCVHGMFSYLGASRTGRWSGRMVQLHNIARGWSDAPEIADQLQWLEPGDMEIFYDDPMEPLKNTVRCAITAPEGRTFSVADLSSIESRVIGWLAGCERINSTFAAGKDSYKDFATQVYRVAYEDVTKEQRGFCKPPTLGCAYMLGWKGLIAYAEGFGVELEAHQAKTLVSVWRETYWEVCHFWEWIKYAVFTCTKTGKKMTKYGLTVQRDKQFLRIVLPSGRPLYYHLPDIQLRQPPWEGDKIPAFTFMGRTPFSRKWSRISSHPGGITENIVQAIARDILGFQMIEMDKRGMDIRLHVHDEVMVMDEQSRLDEMIEIMSIAPPWAEGLILGADGFTCKRYHK